MRRVALLAVAFVCAIAILQGCSMIADSFGCAFGIVAAWVSSVPFFKIAEGIYA